jgi:hypothetical protein
MDVVKVNAMQTMPLPWSSTKAAGAPTTSLETRRAFQIVTALALATQTTSAETRTKASMAILPWIMCNRQERRGLRDQRVARARLRLVVFFFCRTCCICPSPKPSPPPTRMCSGIPWWASANSYVLGLTTAQGSITTTQSTPQTETITVTASNSVPSTLTTSLLSPVRSTQWILRSPRADFTMHRSLPPVPLPAEIRLRRRLLMSRFIL